jgi:hypothetical protein
MIPLDRRFPKSVIDISLRVAFPICRQKRAVRSIVVRSTVGRPLTCAGRTRRNSRQRPFRDDRLIADIGEYGPQCEWGRFNAKSFVT